MSDREEQVGCDALWEECLGVPVEVGENVLEVGGDVLEEVGWDALEEERFLLRVGGEVLEVGGDVLEVGCDALEEEHGGFLLRVG